MSENGNGLVENSLRCPMAEERGGGGSTGMGGRAIMFFQEYGIKGVTGAYGTVRQSVGRYLGGQIKGAAPCRESKEHGYGNIVSTQRMAEDGYEQGEWGRLREEAEALRRQLDQVNNRLDRLSASRQSEEG